MKAQKSEELYREVFDSELSAEDIGKWRSRLDEPLADGLLEIAEDGIRVNEKGAPFIRKICLAFDERYWSKKMEGGQCSQSI